MHGQRYVQRPFLEESLQLEKPSAEMAAANDAANLFACYTATTDALADALMSGQGGAGSDSATLAGVVVAAVVLIIAVVVGAVVYTKRKKDAGSLSGGGLAAFENPMYAGGAPGGWAPAAESARGDGSAGAGGGWLGTSGYMDVPAGGGGSNGAAVYMDVSPGAVGNAPAAGYMDVAPNTMAGGASAPASAAYMDVAPNSGGADFEDGFSDDEEV